MTRFLTFLSFLLFVFVVAITLHTFIYPFTIRPDFTVYMIAAKNVVLHLPLYVHTSSNMSFLYPPSALVFFFPFLPFSLPVAASMWNTLSLLAFIASFWLLFGFLQKGKLLYLFLFLSALLISEPVRETLLFGQNNAFVLLFIVLSFSFSRKKHIRYAGIAGIFLGLAISLKLFPIFLLLYFLSKKQYTVSAIALLVFAFLLSIGTLGHLEYIHDYLVFGQTFLSPASHAVNNQSFSAFLLFLFPAAKLYVSILVMLVYMGSVATCYFIWKKLPKDTFSDFFFFSSILVCTILLITPLVWVHHLVFLFPFCFALLWQVLQRKDTYSLLLFLCTLLLVLVNGEYCTLLLRSIHIVDLPFMQFHALLGFLIGIIGQLRIIALLTR